MPRPSKPTKKVTIADQKSADDAKTKAAKTRATRSGPAATAAAATSEATAAPKKVKKGKKDKPVAVAAAAAASSDTSSAGGGGWEELESSLETAFSAVAAAAATPMSDKDEKTAHQVPNVPIPVAVAAAAPAVDAAAAVAPEEWNPDSGIELEYKQPTATKLSLRERANAGPPPKNVRGQNRMKTMKKAMRSSMKGQLASRKKPIDKLIRSIQAKVQVLYKREHATKFQASAVLALHVATEDFLQDRMRDAAVFTAAELGSKITLRRHLRPACMVAKDFHGQVYRVDELPRVLRLNGGHDPRPNVNLFTRQSSVEPSTFVPTVDEKTGKTVKVDKEPKEKKVGFTDGSIARMARMSGILSIASDCLTEIRALANSFLMEVLKGCDAMADLAKRRTVFAEDVVHVLGQQDRTLYGFSGPQLRTRSKSKDDDDEGVDAEADADEDDDGGNTEDE